MFLELVIDKKNNNTVRERTKRILLMAKTKTKIDEDHNDSPDEPDFLSEYEHGVASDIDTEIIETGKETADIGSNLREGSDSDSDVSEPIGWQIRKK
ncbi:hypothetical protein JTB14_020186 [Gonioctena quinquepunctata]|nr:hypothetical protein JTB14_020186 [Gonioctena quinquepunctata]